MLNPINALERCIFYLLILTTGLLSGCDRESTGVYQPQYSVTPPKSEPLYLFGVHPLHNPKRLHVTFAPLVDYLDEHIDGVRFKLEASRNYAAYDKKLYASRFQLALPNPYQTVNSLQHGYRVFGKMADDNNFRGIILARKNKHIRQVEQLKGHKVSFSRTHRPGRHHDASVLPANSWTGCKTGHRCALCRFAGIVHHECIPG